MLNIPVITNGLLMCSVPVVFRLAVYIKTVSNEHGGSFSIGYFHCSICCKTSAFYRLSLSVTDLGKEVH
jgi:hypothetical protein